MDKAIYKQPCEKMYHVFTNDNDSWVENLSEAVKIARIMNRDHGCVRIYEETNWDEEEGLFIDENCILSYGGFPR